jgi:hypothetical protein
MTIVDKLNHKELHKEIMEKVSWVRDICDKSPHMANPKNNIEPLYGSEIELTVSRGTRVLRIV